MKAGFIGAALGLAAIAAAQPHHHARHEQFHKRDMVVNTVVDYVTDVLEEIVVYMDESGKPVATSTFYKTIEPKTQAPPAPTTITTTSSSEAATTPAASSPTEKAANFLAAIPSQAAAASPAAASSSSSSYEGSFGSGSGSNAGSGAGSGAGSSSGSKGGIGFGNGVSYSPYHGDHNCKSVNDIKMDLQSLNYDVIRLYGTDCDQVENTLDALKALGKNTQLFVGIFDVGSAQSEAQTIIDAVKNHANGDWSKINTVNVGNEVVNNGGSVDQVVSAVNSVRSQLKAAGFNGPVVTVDTMVAHRDHPELGQASDFVAMNCHAFFDGGVAAEGAGEFVLGWVQQLSVAHPNKDVIVCETGWPSQGESNKMAVPSEQNQQAAISSLKSTFSSNMILYSAYNNKWMTSSPAQFQAEQFWGFKGDAPSS